MAHKKGYELWNIKGSNYSTQLDTKTLSADLTSSFSPYSLMLRHASIFISNHFFGFSWPELLYN